VKEISYEIVPLIMVPARGQERKRWGKWQKLITRLNNNEAIRFKPIDHKAASMLAKSLLQTYRKERHPEITLRTQLVQVDAERSVLFVWKSPTNK